MQLVNLAILWYSSRAGGAIFQAGQEGPERRTTDEDQQDDVGGSDGGARGADDVRWHGCENGLGSRRLDHGLDDAGG